MISIIIPVYNVEQYLDKCLQSVIHQTYQDIEIILVDDGSSDNSGILCDKWQEKTVESKLFIKVMVVYQMQEMLQLNKLTVNI